MKVFCVLLPYRLSFLLHKPTAHLVLSMDPCVVRVCKLSVSLSDSGSVWQAIKKNELGFGYLRIEVNIILLLKKNGIFICSSLLHPLLSFIGFYKSFHFPSFNFW